MKRAMDEGLLDDEFLEEIFSDKGRHISFKSTVKRTPKSMYFKAFVHQASRRPYVTVGFHQDTGTEPNGKTIAEVAFYNEFGTYNADGTVRIPERSFMRSAVDDNRDKYNALIEKIVIMIYRGEWDLIHGLEVLGLRVETDIKKRITDLRVPPNAPSTIKKKGSSNPLIDSGAMRAAVRYVVNQGTGKK
jgi:hypothetical protein